MLLWVELYTTVGKAVLVIRSNEPIIQKSISAAFVQARTINITRRENSLVVSSLPIRVVTIVVIRVVTSYYPTKT